MKLILDYMRPFEKRNNQNKYFVLDSAKLVLSSCFELKLVSKDILVLIVKGCTVSVQSKQPQ